MKIKANKDIEGVITEGKVYEASELINGYVFKNDVGKQDYAHKSHFTDVTVADGTFRVVVKADQFHIGPTPDLVVTTPKQVAEPAIEVGSEWLSDYPPEGFATVKYVGDYKVFIKWSDGSEGERGIDSFRNNFRPKPKTVTMYFYLWRGEYISFDKEQTIDLFGPLIFTREIELP